MQLLPRNCSRFTPERNAASMTLVWMRMLDRMKSAGYVSFATIPPTLAAAIKTYSGFASAKNARTALPSSRSSSARVRSSRFSNPPRSSVRTSADPTRPRCPATKMRASFFMERSASGADGHAVAVLLEEGVPARAVEVVRNHFLDHLVQRDLGDPAQLLLRFR